MIQEDRVPVGTNVYLRTQRKHERKETNPLASGRALAMFVSPFASKTDALVVRYHSLQQRCQHVGTARWVMVWMVWIMVTIRANVEVDRLWTKLALWEVVWVIQMFSAHLAAVR